MLRPPPTGVMWIDSMIGRTSIMLYDDAEPVHPAEHYSTAAEVTYRRGEGYWQTFVHCGPAATHPMPCEVYVESDWQQSTFTLVETRERTPDGRLLFTFRSVVLLDGCSGRDEWRAFWHEYAQYMTGGQGL